MYEAIFGLLGVLLGGIVTTGSAYLLDYRREEADARRESRNRAVELKRAARMIDYELLLAQAAAAECVENRRWWGGDLPPFTTESWQKNCGIIAPHLSDEAWHKVIQAVNRVGDIAKSREIAVELGTVDIAISDKISATIAPMLRDLRLGRGALAQFSRDDQTAR